MLTLIIFSALSFTAQTKSDTLPTLRGDEAINKLKETGQYDSLMDAVNAARKENGQRDEPPTEDAVGQSAKLLASDGAASDLFGISVSISGETVIVGAYQDDVGANANQGSAYVFVRSGTAWTQQAKLIAADGAVSDLFGISVSISGETAIVGARFDDVGANTDQGSAYVFVRSGTAWTQQAKLTAAGGGASDNFGYSVSISGDKIIVGAPFSDASVSTPLTFGGKNQLVPQATDQGAMFVFVNAPLAPTAANVSVGGRVLTPEGRGLRNAVVYLTKPGGETVAARTGLLGYYRFDEIEAGRAVVISVVSKRFRFAPQVVTVYDNVTDADFIAQE